MKKIRLRLEVKNKTINTTGEQIKYEDLRKSNLSLKLGYEKLVNPYVMKQSALKKANRLCKVEISKEKKEIKKKVINNSIKDIEL